MPNFIWHLRKELNHICNNVIMASDVSIKSYHVKHRLQLNPLLSAAKKVACYAVQNKSNKRLLTSKYVKEFGLPSSISN